MQALYEQKRISQTRYFLVDIADENEVNLDNLRALYRGSVGGCIVIRYKPD